MGGARLGAAAPRRLLLLVAVLLLTGIQVVLGQVSIIFILILDRHTTANSGTAFSFPSVFIYSGVDLVLVPRF